VASEVRDELAWDTLRMLLVQQPHASGAEALERAVAATQSGEARGAHDPDHIRERIDWNRRAMRDAIAAEDRARGVRRLACPAAARAARLVRGDTGPSAPARAERRA
jgi:hypothetical protein